MPAWAISDNRPTVLSVTVLPPVLGPVITSVVKSEPSHRFEGTTLSGSISGCRARIRLTRPSSLSLGGTAFMLRPSAARAKIMSISARFSRLSPISSASGPIWAEKAARIRSISFFSFTAHCFSSFPASTTDMGSMNSVEPVPDWSCTMPGTFARHSAFTGTTYRPLRMVMIASIRYLTVDGLRTMEFSLSRMRSFSTRMWRRMSFSSELAWSLISSSERIASKMSSSRRRLA